jgi:pimeloyl-ACP methyl ester carboxylesterase
MIRAELGGVNINRSADNMNRRNALYNLLGELPARDRTAGSRKVSTVERENYTLETWMIDLNGYEEVPAYLTRPKRSTGALPAILYNHAHVQGKDELLEANAYLARPPYAEDLSTHGYAVLCIDHWGFGERSGRTETEIFKEMIWQGQVLWGMMVYDSMRALDFLAAQPGIDASRMGTLGLSMGSNMAWWVAALDERIRVCVDLCCMTDFETLIATRGLDGHGIYYYVPRLLKHFDTAQINALIAPRPHLSLNGIYDRLTPQAGLDKIDRELTAVYQNEGAEGAWRLSRYAVGHQETTAMRAEALAFLDSVLRPRG